MNNKSKFLEYLENKHYDQIYKYLLIYIIKNRKSLIMEQQQIINAIDFELEDIGLKSFTINETEQGNIIININANPEISFCKISGKYKDIERVSINNLWFTLTCKAKLTDKLEGFFIINVDQYFQYKQNKPLSGNFIPIISHLEYDKYATEILEKYYPECFEEDNNVDVYELARRMGFTVIERTIAKDKSILGQFYFIGCNVNLYNEQLNAYEKVYIPPNTIIVDSNASSDYSFNCINITIAHECVHGYLHRKAFNFSRMINNKISHLLSCSTNGQIKHISSIDDFSYIESQANGISPCLLLPKNNFLRSYHKQVETNICLGMSNLDAIERAIYQLEDKYKVTKYAIKKRLIDLGIKEVIGVYNFDENQRIKPFGFKGKLLHNETYTIKTKDLFRMFNKPNSEILYKLYCGNYVFVENHICLNDEKYIEIDKKGNLSLTQYARYNVDECCLKLKYKYKNSLVQSTMMFCYLAKESKFNFEIDIDLATSTNNITDIEVSQRIKSKNTIISKLLTEIKSMSFGDAVKHIMKEKGILIKEITDIPHDDSSISYRQFERYINGETKKLTKGYVVAICLSLDVQPYVSEELMKLAGFHLSNSEEDCMLRNILLSCRKRSFDEINQMLTNMGFKPLTNKRN